MTALIDSSQTRVPGAPAMADMPDTAIDPRVVRAANPLVGLWRLMAGFRHLYLLATVTLALGAAAKTASFLLLQYLIDDVLLRDQIATGVLLIAVSFVGLAMVEGTFTYLSGRFAAQTAESITRRLRNYLFDHLQRMTFAFHDKHQTGDLIQRSTSDVMAIHRFYSEQAIGLGRIVLLFSINFTALLILHAGLALFSVIVVPVVALVSYYFFSRISKKYELFQEADAKLTTTLQENLSGVRVVKAFARQDYEIAKFNRDNQERFTRGRKMIIMHSYYWPITDIMTGLQMVAGYLVAATMVINGEITLGTYLAYTGILIYLIQPMRELGRLIVQTSSGFVSYNRVHDLIEYERESLDEGQMLDPKAIRGDVEFHDVDFEYEPGQPVLQGINLHARPGEVVALMGSTGSGKTSLVGLLPRFYEYTRGRIAIDGHDVKDIAKASLRQIIGIVEQEPFLFSRSIRENICYGVGREVSEAEVVQAAQAAAIHDTIMTFPQGYDTIVGEKGVTLSGGQKQRVAIARTLLKNPRILILDDATSSVDMETEAEIRQALDRLMQQRTTFIIAHRVQSVMNADQIVILDQGRIVQQGTHDELLQQDGFYRQIYLLQASIEEELEKELADG
ncbi:MAG: ABC transporter ATP-binding protein [Candidatus Flexifilum sp.]